MPDQRQLPRVDDLVVGVAILGGPHPVVDIVHGEEDAWPRIGPGFMQLAPESLPDWPCQMVVVDT